MRLRLRSSKMKAVLLMMAAVSGGCHNRHDRSVYQGAHIPPPPAKLGYATENIWRRQEDNAEATDFVINEHNFDSRDSARLNAYGKDHLKQVAARLRAGSRHPVIIERSMYSLDPNTAEDDFNYPIHADPELDNQRREVIAQVLEYMGVPHADERVVVSISPTAHLEGRQAVQNYGRFQSEINRASNLGLYGPQGFGFGLGNFGGFGGGTFY